jgi:hypothetical protein
MGDITSPEGSLADLPGDLIVTGDFHSHGQIRVKRPDGSEVTVLSPGATHMRRINEPANHSVWLVGLPESGPPVTVSLPLRSRPVVRYAILERTETIGDQLESMLTAASAKAEADNLPEEIRRPIFQVSCQAAAVSVLPEVRRVLADRAFLFERILTGPSDEGGVVVDDGTVTFTTAPTLVDCLPMLAAAGTKLFDRMHRLLTAVNPKVELAEMRKEVV